MDVRRLRPANLSVIGPPPLERSTELFLVSTKNPRSGRSVEGWGRKLAEA